MLNLNNSWNDILKDQFEKDYFKELLTFLEVEYSFNKVYPLREDIFRAFELCDYNKVKVVILGQDPYHEPGQAHGLAFSVLSGTKIPPSLRNIFKEMEMEFGRTPEGGDLSYLAAQGVLLLNTVLTVRAHEAFSHKNKGWETFTDRVISVLGEREDPIVFLFWGKPAGEKEKLISNEKHLVLKAPHPSPLSASRGFIGCNHFIKCNQYLISNNVTGINWVL